MSKTQIRGPQRMGAHVLAPGDAAVVDSYAGLGTEDAQRLGQPAAAAVLPLRRELWRLAEMLLPRRLAAALRARGEPGDPTGRDGVRELRLALADWLDPPPCCRWCRRPLREGDHGRQCQASRARGRGCRPSRTRHAPGGGPARCGTLALYPAVYVSLEVMAAALACPRGASRAYDVAADRDGRALLAAAGAPPAGRDPDDPGAWSDEGLRRLHAAVAGAAALHGEDVPPQVVAARDRLDRARDRSVRANGRLGVAVQLRYGAPSGGITRADLVQGAALGLDRAAMDYDAGQARYSTYAAAWARQGVGEALSSRDVVGTPAWVLDLRRLAEERLRAHGPGVARDLLRAVEAAADAAHESSPPAARSRLLDHCLDLVRILAAAEARENVPGTRPPRYVLRPLLPGVAADPDAALGLAADLAAAALRPRPKRPPKTPVEPEDPERARERVAAWVAARLELPKASGAGMLAALRHGAPVFVQVGAGQDHEDDDRQGTDGAGGTERAAAVLAAPDEEEARAEEEADARRWQAALSALAELRGQSREAAEVVRRHHGLDGVAEHASGAGGESFASIAESGLACAPGRKVCKETVRKLYKRGMEALRAIVEGRAPDLAEDERDEAPRRAERPTAVAWLTACTAEPAEPLAAPRTTEPPSPRRTDDGGSWAAWREAAAAVAW